VSKQAVTKGATSQIVYVFIRDSSATTGAGLTGLAFNSASLVASYVRPAAARVAITLATQTTTGAFSSGGFVEVDATNMPGIYRLDVPDAVFATGVNSAVVMLKGATNMESCVIEFELKAVDQQDTVRSGLTALPNAAAEAAGGLYTRGSGAGQLNQSANGQVDINVARWLNTAVATPPVAGVPNVNVSTWNNLTTVALPLVPTVAGRTLDVSLTGEAGLDWANIGAPTTAVNLSGTNIDADQVVASVTGAVGSVTGAVGSVTGAVGSVTGAVGSVTGNVGGNVVGSVASVTASVTVGAMAANVLTAAATAADFTTEIQTGLATAAALATVQSDVTTILADTNDIQARLPAALVGGRMDASVGAMASNVLTAAATAADFGAEIADAVWDEVTSGHSTAGTAGFELQSGGAVIIDTVATGTPTSTTIQLTAGATIDNFYNDQLLYIASGTGAGQVRPILSYTGATRTAAFDEAFVTIPASGDRITVRVSHVHPLSQIADKVWDEALAGHLTAGSTGAALNAAGAAGDPWITTLPGAYVAGQAGYIIGTNLDAQVSAVQSDTNDIQARLPAALVSGRMDASVGAMAANVLTAAATAADFTTEIQTGLATAAALATAQGDVTAILADTAEIGTAGAGLTALASAANLSTVNGTANAIKAKTDSLTFTVAGKADANITHVIADPIQQNGSTATNWGGAP
jgi:hypothetical protein